MLLRKLRVQYTRHADPALSANMVAPGLIDGHKVSYLTQLIRVTRTFINVYFGAFLLGTFTFCARKNVSYPVFASVGVFWPNKCSDSRACNLSRVCRPRLSPDSTPRVKKDIKLCFTLGCNV